MRVARWSRLPLAAAALGLVLAAPAQAQPPIAEPPSRAPTQGEEVFFSVLATAANIFYVPLKAAIAAVAMPAGGFAGAASGGDARAAYAIWVPALGGTFFLTPEILTGSEPFEFFGSNYPDEPLPTRRGGEETVIFDNAATGTYATPPTRAYGSSTTSGTYGSYYGSYGAMYR
jgi:hypothetical protein